MASENLQIPDIQANQNQKEVTANAQTNLLDRAINGNGTNTRAVTVSFQFTTTETRENPFLELTGTPGVAFTADMSDANRRSWAVYNNTDSVCTIRNSVGGGTGQPVIPVGKLVEFYYDGTNFTDTTEILNFGSPLVVEEDGVGVTAETTTINFTGAGKSVEDAGAGEAIVTIPGTAINGLSPIVQTVNARDDVARTNATAAITTYETLTTSITITPGNPQNRVRIRVTGNIQNDQNGGVSFLTLFRSTPSNPTPVNIMPSALDGLAVIAKGDLESQSGFTIEHVDDPVTSEPVTYTIYGRTAGNAGENITIGGSGGVTTHDTSTYMVAEELLDDTIQGLGQGGPTVQHVHVRDDTPRINATAATVTYETLTTAVTITPSSSSNRVRVRVSGVVTNDNSNGITFLTLFRNDTTDLTPGGRDGIHVQVALNANNQQSFAFEFIDSPATTSATTYTIYAKTNGQAGENVLIGGRLSTLECPTVMVAEEILNDGTAGDPLGPIVQHVQTQDAVTRTNPTAATVAFESLTANVSITPTDRRNRVRVRVFGHVSNDVNNGISFITLFRDGSVDLTPAGRDGMTAIEGNATNSQLPFAFEFVDSPDSIAATTYTLYGKTSGAGGENLTIGGRGGSAVFDGVTFITAEEITADGKIILPKTIPLDVGAVREIATNDTQNLAAHGGIMASDSTPTYGRVNLATDKALRLTWAAADVTEVQFPPVPMPADIDSNKDVTVHLLARMAAATDTPTIDVQAFDGIGDTEMGGATPALSATLQELTVTLANADISGHPLGFLNIALIPGAHGTDALELYAAWIEYIPRQA